MNFLGHTHVALAGGREDGGFLLGAVLPDLAPMVGVRVDRAALAGPLAEGVRCHVRADEAFHGHPVFLAGARALRLALGGRGVPSGAARAVGHAGWELLLDGALVGTSTEAAFRRAMAAGGEAAAAMSRADAGRWAAFVARGRDAPPLRYDDPRWVADRLHAMLARRPRLRLPADRVGDVAEVLAAEAGRVRSVAADVLADTVGATHGR